MTMQTQRMQTGTNPVTERTTRDWRPDWLRELDRKQAERIAVVEQPESVPGNGGVLDENKYFWGQISESEYDFLTGPRTYPASCAWCGGRLVHTAFCDELRVSWEAVMLFGKHKGKRISAVPRDYLQWLLVNSNSLSQELAEAIRSRLRAAA